MPTIGALRATLPKDPANAASPKVKTPPSAPTSQYPPPSGVAAMPTIGALSPGTEDPGTVDAAVPKAGTAAGSAEPDSTCVAATGLERGPGWPVAGLASDPTARAMTPSTTAVVTAAGVVL